MSDSRKPCIAWELEYSFSGQRTTPVASEIYVHRDNGAVTVGNSRDEWRTRQSPRMLDQNPPGEATA